MSKHQIQPEWVWRIGRVARGGTAEPVSRGHILRRERDRKIFIFPVQLATSRIGNITRFIHTLLDVMNIHSLLFFVSPRLMEPLVTTRHDG